MSGTQNFLWKTEKHTSWKGSTLQCKGHPQCTEKKSMVNFIRNDVNSIMSLFIFWRTNDQASGSMHRPFEEYYHVWYFLS